MNERPVLSPILSAILDLARQQPDRTALWSREFGALTFGQLAEWLDAGCTSLAARGIRPGVRTGLLVAGGASGLLTQLLCLSSATSVPLNPACTSVELRQQLSGAGVQLLLTDDPARAARLGMDLPVLTLGVSRHAGGGFDFGDFDRGGLADAGHGSPDTSLILHTSGSTGTPKAVPLGAARLLASARNIGSTLALSPADTALNLLPQFHIGALVDLLLAPLLAGGSVVIGERFDSRSFYELGVRYPITWFQAVPAMLRDLLDFADRHDVQMPQQLRFIRAVSSALAPRLLADIEAAFGCPVIEMYGMSETAGQIASNPLPPAPRKPGSVGRPAGPEVCILGEAGRCTESGQRGEILVRGDNVMAGYLGSDGKEFLDGWFRTGDEGYFDSDGYLFLHGRIKETINRGGEKISPLEVDRVASEYPGVAEAAAFALDHPTLGEEIALAVVPQPGARIDSDGLKAFLHEHLAAYKQPRRVFLVNALPRAPGGKLQRHLLPALCAEASGNSVPARNLQADEHELAELWSGILGVDVTSPDANFFDLGGDSLKAIWLIEALHDMGHDDLTAADLHLDPSLAALNRRLRQPRSVRPVIGQAAPRELDGDPAIASLRAYVRGWHGNRSSADALLTGRNLESTAVPLFWCCNGAGEFEALADALGPDQPIYGMRTLFEVPGRRAEHVAPLADAYLAEIEALRPAGPYLLGGFCEGAKFAFHIATRLREQGHEVALLALQEHFVPQRYDGPVALYTCQDRESVWTPFFVAPDLTWQAIYTGPIRIAQLQHKHDDCYRDPQVAEFAAQLRQDIGTALARTFGSDQPRASLRILGPEAMRAELTVRGGRWLRAGRRTTLRVRVRNIGAEVWQPTRESRILVGCRWLTSDLRPRHRLAGHASLTDRLKPGASVELALPVHAPDKLSWRKLQLDVFQDGVGWFADTGSDLVVRRVLVC